MPLKNLTQAPPSHLAHSDPRMPSIRLISAIPSAAGSSDPNSTIRVFDDPVRSSSPTPWDSMPPPPPVTLLKHHSSRLLPKKSTSGLAEASSSATRLVPKKSKRRLLGSLGNALPFKENARGNDFSDVVRRVAAGNGSSSSPMGSAKLKGGFEIYVDPSADPDMSDIMVVKKQKSRAALNDMGWGPTNADGSSGRGVLGEVTNGSSSNLLLKKEKEKEGGGMLKVKVDEDKKWWSIGRGRKDSKDERKVKEKEKENGARSRASSPVPPPRSQTPDPFKGVNAQSEQSRGRFNSLDAGILLGLSKRKSNNVLASEAPTVREPPKASSPPPTMRRGSHGDMLSNPQLHPQTQPRKMERIPTPPQMTYSRSATPTFGGLFSGPGAQTGGLEVPAPTNASNQGSIALRAMRSVKSFARIGSWAQGKSEDMPKKEKEKTVKEKKKAKEGGEEKKSRRVSKKEKEKDDTVRRMSGSSFEAGALSSGPMSDGKAGSVSRKHSILGLGLPSSMRLPRMRSGSAASSLFGATPSPAPPVPPIPNRFGTVNSVLSTASSNGGGSDNAGTINAQRLSVDSAVAPEGRRRTSIQSTASSLRPNSITSTLSGTSTRSRGSADRCSSGASIRWDEEGIQRAKAEREKEVLTKRESVKKAGKKTSRDSRRTSESRRRTGISDIFPEVMGGGASKPAQPEPEVRRYPIVTIEEATADGHGDDLNEPIMEESEEEEESVQVVATPMKKPRARPLSEQLLGKPRPLPVHEGEDGVLGILSAATNDLAQLVNNLDLEATPATPDMTPLRPSASPFGSEPSTSMSRSIEYNGSPLKKKEIVGTSRGVRGIGVRASAASISSLRPYGQSKTVNNGHPTIRGKPSFSETMLGKAIPSWPLPEKTSLAELRAKLKPVVSPKASSVATAKPVELPSPPLPSFIKAHKRSMTPIREPDPAPVFEPLQPPPSKRQANVVKAKSKVSPPPERIKDTFDDSSEDEDRYRTLRAKKASKGPSERTFGSLVTDKASGARTIGRGSKMSTASSVSSRKMSVEKGVPMSREARRMLGMSGTMGGSVVSAYQVELDESDPDSDVPEELRHILKKDEAETITYQGVGVEENQSDDEEYRDDSSFTGRLHQFDEDDMTMDIRAPRSRSVSPFDPAALARFSCSTEVNMSEAEIQQAHLLPVFRAQLITDTAALDADFDEDCFTASDENNTKRSFNFTEELAKLTEAGDSDRRSFVEQLENAFRTPTKIDLRADFGVTLDVPPVPPLPDYLRRSIAPPVEAGSSYVSEGDSELSIGVGRDACSDESHVMESPVPAFFRDSQSSKTSMSSKKSSSPSFKMGESASRSMDMKQPSIDIASVSPSTAGTTSSLKSKASTLSSASRRSDHSDGQLNRSFKFGGLSSTSPTPAKVPQSPGLDSLFDNISMEDSPDSSHCRPLTLSDVIPPPSHVREVSFSSSMLDDYEDSALKSLIAETMSGVPQNSNRPQPRERTISEASLDPRVSRRFSNFIPLTRPSSGVSFAGLDSYDEVRRGFEFNDQRPNFYPGTNVPTAHSRGHRAARDSVFSIASVSSYGRVIRDGATDPFDYGVAPPSHMPSLQERSHEEDMTQSSIGTQMYDESFDMSTQVEDTFSFINHRPVLRRRVDSDASSFYCGAPASTARGVRRRSSNFSVSSISGMPPVSMYTRGFGHHRRSSSVTSASSIALNYAHGGVGARAILARHRREVSVDSGYSDFSPMRPTARPGIGDKMFETAAPLAAIPRSPEQSVSGDFLSADYGPNRTSFGSFDYYDSIIDADDAYSYRFHPQRDSIAEEYEDEERPSSISDSLFDQTRLRSSADSASLFGNDNDSYMPPHQFRPLSMMSSMGDPNSPMRDDDTIISMIGGGHVRRRSVVSMIAASPCVRMEKKAIHRRTARAVLQEMKKAEKQARVVVPSPAKPKTVELKPSIVSTASTHFGDDRMVSAQHGLLARQSLEESVLVASGEDRSVSFQAPVFSRPKPVSRSRSSTCTSESSGRDTPPLSPSDGASVSGGSFSSIDMAEMSASLSNVSQPSSTLASARARAQNIGHSHRRRYSRAQITRSSVYETIDEEDTTWSSSSSPAQSMFSSATNKLQPAVEDSTAVYVVGSDTESIYNADDPSTWDDERGIVALRKFYNLKDEAHTTVQESQRTWIDTPFSLYALQTFDPPRQPEAMKAMLEHSLRAFGPLPAELRRMRSRKNSRPSPYPAARTFKTSMTSSPFECPPQAKLSTSTTATTKTQATVPTPVLKEKKLNTVNHVPESHKPTSLFVMKDNNIEDSAQRPTAAAKAALGSGTIRARVPSAARRSALGWAKRSNGPKSSSDKKENVVGEGSIVMTPADGLRLNRPRPRNSRTPASQARPIRV